MKYSLCITALLSFLFCVLVEAVSADNSKTSSCISAAALNELRHRVANAGKCKANMCFAIDGSGSINGTEFKKQINFVLDLVSLFSVDDGAAVAACQYASTVTPIQQLTTDIGKFNSAVGTVDQMGGKSYSIGAINYCITQLLPRVGEANTIVILGDARSNVNPLPLRRLDLFRRVGGSVYAVGAGVKDDAALLRIAGGNKDLVFETSNILDPIGLNKIIEKLASQICGL